MRDIKDLAVQIQFEQCKKCDSVLLTLVSDIPVAESRRSRFQPCPASAESAGKRSSKAGECEKSIHAGLGTFPRQTLIVGTGSEVPVTAIIRKLLVISG